MSQFQTVHLFNETDEFSSDVMNNESKFPHDATNDKKDIVIQIRDQETSNNKYINYIIEINIKSDNHLWMDKIVERSWSVLRRYSEFDNLRSALIKMYPACLIPPLPSKIASINPWSVVNQKKDTEFIDSRRQRLEMFLNRLLVHPKLKGEKLIFKFLSKMEDWNEISLKKDLTNTVGSIVNWRWINVQSRFIHIFDNNANMVYFNELIKSNSLSDEAIKLVDRGKQLQENVKKLLNCLSKVDEQTSILHHLYKNYGEAFFDWCAMDQSIGDTLQSFGHICDTYSTIIDNPVPTDRSIILPPPGSSIGGVYTILSWNEISLLLQELYEYGESWIELAGRMAFLHKQLTKQMARNETKYEQLEKLRSGQPQKSGGFTSLTSRFRKSLSESEVSQLTSSLEATLIDDNKSLESIKASKDLFDKCIDEELENFETFRTRDMHIVMHSYACNQLAHSERCLRLWQRARQTLD